MVLSFGVSQDRYARLQTALRVQSESGGLAAGSHRGGGPLGARRRQRGLICVTTSAHEKKIHNER